MIDIMRTRSNIYWLLILLFMCIALRLFIIRSSDPIYGSDTRGYIEVAQYIIGNLSTDLGERTPGYPIFIILMGFNPEVIRFVQMLIGLIIVVILFTLALKITNNGFVSALVGSFYGLNLSQIVYENSLLTETLSVFLMILSIVIFFALWSDAERFRSNWYLILLGFIACLLAMVRPFYVFLPVMFFLLWFLRQVLSRSYLKAVNSLFILMPAILIIGGWSLFNHERFGYFGPTTLTGYNLTNHTGAFFELYDGPYNQIRDIYITHRDDNIAMGGRNSMTIWSTFPELMNKTGMTYSQVSAAMTEMSFDLIIHHPWLYLESVFQSWVQFWNELGWWRWEYAHNDQIATSLGNIWRIEKIVLVIQNFIFLLISVSLVISYLIRRPLSINRYLVLTIIIVLITSITQAFLEYGANARYSLQTKPLVSLIVICLTYQIIRWGVKKWTALRIRPGAAYTS